MHPHLRLELIQPGLGHRPLRLQRLHAGLQLQQLLRLAHEVRAEAVSLVGGLTSTRPVRFVGRHGSIRYEPPRGGDWACQPAGS